MEQSLAKRIAQYACVGTQEVRRLRRRIESLEKGMICAYKKIGNNDDIMFNNGSDAPIYIWRYAAYATNPGFKWNPFPTLVLTIALAAKVATNIPRLTHAIVVFLIAGWHGVWIAKNLAAQSVSQRIYA